MPSIIARALTINAFVCQSLLAVMPSNITLCINSPICNVKVIKSSPELDLEVRNVGRVPGSFESHQTYTWVDPTGRTVSPPPEVDRVGRYDPSGERKSGLMLLKDADERKVSLRNI